MKVTAFFVPDRYNPHYGAGSPKTENYCQAKSQLAKMD